MGLHRGERPAQKKPLFFKKKQKPLDKREVLCIIVYTNTINRKLFKEHLPSQRLFDGRIPAMLEISKNTNLLEQRIYKYELQDVAEPNLYRDI